MKKTRKSAMPVSADAIARLADQGKDVSHFFKGQGRMVQPIQRVNVDVTATMLEELHKAAQELNVSRQAVIKTLVRQALDHRRPLPFLGGSLTYWCSCDSSTYHSLQTKIEKRFSNDLSFLAAYTWGKSIDEVSQASLGFNNSASFRDQRNRRAEKARSDYDIGRRFVMSYTYELPFARNSKGAAKALLDGWQILGIHAFNTGNPITIGARTNFSNAGGSTRPDVVPGVSLEPPSGKHREQWFNPAAFQNTTAGKWGNAGRNTLSQPGLISADFSVFKNFQIRERNRLQFRAEAFNLPNHSNFRGLSATFDATNPGELTSAAAGRQIQIALKYLW